MDTGETYIKMCEKAEEIQIQNPGGSQGEFVYCEGKAYQEMDDRPLTPFIWLPRQDQLQEMVSGEPYETMIYGNIKINETSDFISLLPNILLFAYDWDYGGDNITLTYKQPYQSMEQLWLAFVMKEKFNKTWDGDKWQK